MSWHIPYIGNVTDRKRNARRNVNVGGERLNKGKPDNVTTHYCAMKPILRSFLARLASLKLCSINGGPFSGMKPFRTCR